MSARVAIISVAEYFQKIAANGAFLEGAADESVQKLRVVVG